jgi:hypothetical protein
MPVWAYETATASNLNAQEIATALRSSEPIVVMNATISGDLLLSDIRFVAELFIIGTVFLGRLELKKSELCGLVRLTDCKFAQKVSFEASRFGNNLSLNGSSFDADLGLEDVNVNEDVSLVRAKIAGTANFTGVTAKSLDMSAAKVDEPLFISGASVGRLNLHEADLKTLSSHSKLDRGKKGTKFASLWLSSSRIDSVYLEATQVQGDVEIINADIGALTFASVDSDPSSAATPTDRLMQRAGSRSRVRGNIRLEGSKFAREITLKGVGVVGVLGVRDCEIGGEFTIRDGELKLGLLCQDNVFQRAFVLGGLRLGSISISGGQMHHGIRVIRSGYSSVHCGKVTVQDVTVTGEAELNGINCELILLRRLTVKGDLRIAEGPYFENSVLQDLIILDSTVEGDLMTTRTCVNGSLTFQRLTIDTWNRFERTGFTVRKGGTIAMMNSPFEIHLSGMRFDGGLGIENSVLNQVYCELGECPSIHIRYSKIRRLSVNRQFSNLLDLSYSNCGILDLSGGLPDKLDLTEFTFDQVMPDRIGFRQLLEKTRPFFSRSIFLFVENWLRTRGRDVEATEVYIQMRRLERSQQDYSRGSFSDLLWLGWNQILDAGMWLGLESHRLALYFAIVLTASGIAFAQPGALVPKRQEKGEASIPTPAARPMDGFWMAVQYNIPLVTLPVAERLEPSIQRIGYLPFTYADLAAILRMLGWIAAPLFVAALTGLLKRSRQK